MCLLTGGVVENPKIPFAWYVYIRVLLWLEAPLVASNDSFCETLHKQWPLGRTKSNQLDKNKDLAHDIHDRLIRIEHHKKYDVLKDKQCNNREFLEDIKKVLTPQEFKIFEDYEHT